MLVRGTLPCTCARDFRLPQYMYVAEKLKDSWIITSPPTLPVEYRFRRLREHAVRAEGVLTSSLEERASFP